MAPVLSDILGTITMDFSKGSHLGGREHEEAFYAAFAFATGLLPSLAGEYEEIVLSSSVEIENGDIPVRKDRKPVRRMWRKGVKYLYRYDTRVFFENQSSIAFALYRGDAHAYHLRPDSQRPLDLLVSADPIYFRFSSSS